MNVKARHTLNELLTLYWSNRTYADYDELRLAGIDSWQKAALNPELIQSVCRASYDSAFNY